MIGSLVYNEYEYKQIEKGLLSIRTCKNEMCGNVCDHFATLEGGGGREKANTDSDALFYLPEFLCAIQKKKNFTWNCNSR